MCIAAGLTAALAGCALADSDTGYSGSFTIDNRTGDQPSAWNTRSPQGRHFIPGMPGTLTFQTDVQWNGGPGTVYLTVNGARLQAGITDLGGGHARAEVTIAAPSVVGGCSEVTVEVTNAAGKKTVVNGGLHFSPIPYIVTGWYRDNIPWTPSGLALVYKDENTKKFWDWRSGILTTTLSGGIKRELYFDPLAANFGGSIGGIASLGLNFDLPSFEVIGSAALGLDATMKVSYAGCGSPKIVPGWQASLNGKVGGGAKLVPVVGHILGAGAVVEPLMTVPVIKDILGIPRLRLFVTPGGLVRGQYTTLGQGTCFLWTDSISGSWTLGLEGQAALKLWSAEVGVYAGASGSPEWQLCPDFTFNGITLRGYTGAFASCWGYSYKQEIGIRLRWDNSGSLAALASAPLKAGGPSWQPIGDSLLEYGGMNRLPQATSAVKVMSSSSPLQTGGSAEEVVVENVTRLSGPCVMADSQGSRMLFPLHDPNKPWHSATDIAYLQAAGGSWSIARIADDQAAEFTPQAAVPNGDSTLAAWARVSGDISQTTSPEQVAPHLEIVVSKLDVPTGQWRAPAQITANFIVDRDPVPVLFGSQEGVLWVRNEAGAAPGDATHGDSLMFCGWNGSTWSAPAALWSDDKGLISLAYVADGSGEGHAVFAVDEDGDLETRTDRELYQISTTAGAWGSPALLTNDSVEDSLPTLVAPNGNPMLVWNSGGALKYTSLSAWNPRTVYSEYSISNEASTLDGVTLPGGAAIAYAVQLPTGVDIVASFYDAALDSWSLPRQLTADTDVETALSLGCDGNQLVIGYLKNRTVRGPVDVVIDGQIQHLEDIPQPSRTDLCVLKHELGSDLAAGAITVDPANPAPASSATITATVENRGDCPEAGIDVAFFDGDPTSGGTQIGSTQTVAGPLAAGTSATLTANWSVPTGDNSHRAYVVVDGDLSVDDRDRANNTASTQCVLPDLTVETGWSSIVSADAVAMTAKIVNQGVLGSGAFEVGWHIGSPGGPEIGRSPVGSIAAGANTEVTCILRPSEPPTTEFVQVCAVADCASAVTEADESNNVGCQLVKAPSYEQPTLMTIGAAKHAQDHAPVNLDAKIVTARFAGCVYIEEPDRSSGVKVATSALWEIGDAVTVTGRVDASGDEVAIDADSVEPATSSPAIKPLGLRVRSLGGSACGLQALVNGASGLNNIGLLVRTWGKVTQIGGDYLYVDDDSHIKDGTLTGSTENVGVRVVCDPTGYVEGEYLLITGISSCFNNALGEMQRRVLVRRASDIQPVSRQPLSLPRVSDAKSVAQGTPVTVKDKKVTSVFGGFFYIEEMDRSSGIKVLSDTPVSPGDLTWITGQIGTWNGERQIVANQVSSLPDAPLLGPLGMRTPWLGGAAFNSQPAVAEGFGLSNIGLLVRVWGRVTQIGTSYLYVDDGAGLEDGSSTLAEMNRGVRIICDPSGFTSGDYVVVTGASSCYPAGVGYGRQVYATGVQRVGQ